MAHTTALYVREQRWRTTGWILLFGAFSIAVVRGYRQAYPTLEDRREFAELVSDNVGFRVLNGLPDALDTLGGFAAWRLSALTVFAAAWALLTTTRLLRGEEDAGRWELLAAGRMSRAGLCASVLGSVWLGLLALGVVTSLVLVLVGLPVVGTICFVSALLGPAAGWIGIAGVTSQLWPTRRQAAIAAGALLGVALLLRVIADAQEVGWLRWSTPLGWYELVRPYGDPRLLPLVLYGLLVVVATSACLALAARRDLGGATLERHEERSGRLLLLGAPWQLAAREQARPLLVWACGLWGFAAILGLLVEDVAGVLEESAGFRELLTNLVVSGVVVDQYVSIVLVFMCLLVGIHAVTNVVAMREEESSGRLDMLLSLPIGRLRWIVQRTLVTIVACGLLLLGAAIMIWATAQLRDATVELGDMLDGARNWFAAVVAFHGVGIALFGAAPRVAGGLAGAIVLASFTWWAVGSLVDVPDWTLWPVPFEQLAHVPAAPIDGRSVVSWMLVGGVGYVTGIAAFLRRDIQPD